MAVNFVVGPFYPFAGKEANRSVTLMSKPTPPEFSAYGHAFS